LDTAARSPLPREAEDYEKEDDDEQQEHPGLTAHRSTGDIGEHSATHA
jgi:hypothetical protein